MRRRRSGCLCMCVILMLATTASAQSTTTAPILTRDADGKPVVRATRAETPLRIDGRLDEDIYSVVEAVGTFVQQEPDEGQPATEKTEAWVLFDDDYIYVSARCWESRARILDGAGSEEDSMAANSSEAGRRRERSGLCVAGLPHGTLAEAPPCSSSAHQRTARPRTSTWIIGPRCGAAG